MVTSYDLRLLCRLLTSASSLAPLLMKALLLRAAREAAPPDKDMNFHCTAAAFTLFLEPVGFVILDPKRFAGPALLTHPWS